VLHSSVCCHIASTVTDLFRRLNWEALEHLSHSLDTDHTHKCTVCIEYCKYVKNEMVKQNFEIISNKSNTGSYKKI
jgi:hypothetical protein